MIIIVDAKSKDNKKCFKKLMNPKNLFSDLENLWYNITWMQLYLKSKFTGFPSGCAIRKTK